MKEFVENFILELKNRGFTQVQEDLQKYQIDINIQQPPQRIMFNNQIFEQPSPPIHVHNVVEYIGNGSFDDVEFAVIKFDIYQNNVLNQSFAQGFYKSDYEELMRYLREMGC